MRTSSTCRIRDRPPRGPRCRRRDRCPVGDVPAGRRSAPGSPFSTARRRSATTARTERRRHQRPRFVLGDHRREQALLRPQRRQHRQAHRRAHPQGAARGERRRHRHAEAPEGGRPGRLEPVPGTSRTRGPGPACEPEGVLRQRPQRGVPVGSGPRPDLQRRLISGSAPVQRSGRPLRSPHPN